MKTRKLGYVALTDSEVKNKNMSICLHTGDTILQNELLIQPLQSAKKDQKQDKEAGYKSKVYKVILEECL